MNMTRRTDFNFSAKETNVYKNDMVPINSILSRASCFKIKIVLYLF